LVPASVSSGTTDKELQHLLGAPETPEDTLTSSLA